MKAESKPTLGVPTATLAKLWNVTTRYVYKLATMPGFPAQVAKGRWDASLTTIWYLRFLQAELERRGLPGGVNTPAMRAARLRLISAQVVKVQMDNDVAAGRLIPKGELIRLWSQRIVNCKMKLRGLPNSLGPQLTNSTDPTIVTERLTATVNEALAELDGSPTGRADPRRDKRRRRVV